jgi:hypothetical protein
VPAPRRGASQGAKLLHELKRLHVKITVEVTRPGLAPLKNTSTITIPAPKAPGKRR